MGCSRTLERMSKRVDERLSGSKVASHLGVMVVVAVLMGVVAAGLAIPFAGAVGMGARGVADSIDELPADLTPEDLNQKTQILDSKGTVIAELYKENRTNVSLDQISPIMIKAIVAIEDYRFYQHGALDVKGTLRAFLTNQANSGTVQGGSSITQQMVKLTLQDQAGSKEERAAATDDTYARKIRELRYAIAFEKNYDKDWILERYLNIAYFGDGAYGIQAAAKHYFNVNAAELNLKQSALLAGLVKNPTGYDPTNSRDRAIERRNVVLDRMAQLSVIPQKRSDKVKDQSLGLTKVQKTPRSCATSRAPFFCDYVVNYVLQDKELGKTLKERKQALYGGGLTVHTTLDLRFQDAADSAVQSHAYPTDSAVGALAMVEPGTGQVKAIAQSRPMGTKAGQGQTFLNYAVPEKYGDSDGFQAGSTFKAFVLAAAINKGIPLSRTIPSPPSISIPISDFKTCGNQYLAGSDTWTVGNSTTSGSKNLYSGTQESVNTFYAQLERMTGLCEPYQLAQDMGITLNDPDTQRVPSFVLGVTNTNTLEMAEAYATFAAHGEHCASRPVTSIEDSDGKSVRKYDANCRRVMPESTADAVSDVLKGVMEPGGFGSGIAPAQPSAGKTGTIQDNKSVWFVGYTPNLATAAMLAGVNDQGHWISLNGQTVGGSYISSASGSGNAGPIWGEAMGKVQQWLPDTEFVKPSASDVSGVSAVVPSVGGLSVDAATAELEAAGFSVSVAGSDYSSYPTGTVAYTSPGSGSFAYSGDTISIYTSDGPAPVKPDKPDKPKNHGGGNGGGGNGGGGNGGGGNGGGGGGRR